MHVWGDTKINTDLTVSGSIWQGITFPGSADYVYDDYDDIQLLRYPKEGKFDQLPASIASGGAKNLNAENALLRDAILQLEERVRRLERLLKEVVEEKGKRQIISSLK